jgi:PBP1b-binding outer membrane lipoprotein LpoB
MKKYTLFIGLALMLFLTSCGNSGNQSETNNSNDRDTKQVSEKKVSDLLTQQSFEKMLNIHGISLYPDLEFKNIEENDDGDIKIIYTVPDLSDESHEKVCSYIDTEFSKLENNGWNTMPAAHIAMKKDGNKKIGIQINEAFYKPGNLHEIYITYGTVE